MNPKKFTDFNSEDEWKAFCRMQLDSCKDFELMLIKGHVLMEYLLNYFIENSNPNVKVTVSNFFFAKKLKIYEMFCYNATHIQELYFFNSMRNDIAHSIGVENEKIEKFFSMFLIPNELKVDRINSFGFTLSYLLASLYVHILVHFERNNVILKSKEVMLETYKRVYPYLSKE